MRWQQSVLGIISEGVSLCRLAPYERNGLRILTYHSIGSYTHGDSIGLSTVTVERFIQDLDIIKAFHPVALSPIQIPDTELRAVVTFDDGYADNLYVAAPLLVERNIPFTVFVATEFIQRREKGFLSPDELKQLSRVSGAKIGAHSHSHCNLTLCSDRALKSELADSKKYIEDLIGMPVTDFAYPYGIADMRVRDAVHHAGYEIATCSRFDINRRNRDCLMLNRTVVLSTDTARTFKLKLSGAWDWLRWASPDPLYL